jgi:hypothetical protein
VGYYIRRRADGYRQQPDIHTGGAAPDRYTNSPRQANQDWSHMSKSKEKKRSILVDAREPWIKGRTGLLIIAVLSVATGIFTGVNVFKMLGLGQAVLWGIGSCLADCTCLTGCFAVGDPGDGLTGT